MTTEQAGCNFSAIFLFHSVTDQQVCVGTMTADLLYFFKQILLHNETMRSAWLVPLER